MTRKEYYCEIKNIFSNKKESLGKNELEIWFEKEMGLINSRFGTFYLITIPIIIFILGYFFSNPQNGILVLTVLILAVIICFFAMVSEGIIHTQKLELFKVYTEIKKEAIK